METLETVLLIAAIMALVAGMQWLDQRFELGWGCDARFDFESPARKKQAQAEIDRLRARIEELEAVVSEPEFATAREFAKL